MMDYLGNLQVSFKIKGITSKMWSRIQDLTAIWRDGTHFKKGGVHYWLSSLNLATSLHSTVILLTCSSWRRRTKMCHPLSCLWSILMYSVNKHLQLSMSAFWTLWLSSRHVLLKTIEVFLAKLGGWSWIKIGSFVHVSIEFLGLKCLFQCGRISLLLEDLLFVTETVVLKQPNASSVAL